MKTTTTTTAKKQNNRNILSVLKKIFFLNFFLVLLLFLMRQIVLKGDVFLSKISKAKNQVDGKGRQAQFEIETTAPSAVL